MNEIFNYLKKPDVYEESTSKFWDDEHISKGMLEAHLNPTWDAASRRLEFIEKSVNWISSLISSKVQPKVLDLGCGPGLYTTQFDQLGYQVTGIDYSKRSIEYAKKENARVHYLYKNYLDINYENEFDLITLIYCDYAVLSLENRKKLLKKIHRGLKKGGLFIFDVLTENYYKNKKEATSWTYHKDGGFWMPKPHLELKAHYLYENNVHLDQYIIIDEENHVDVHNVWNTGFTKDRLIRELSEVGFSKESFYSDVCGKPFDELSDTMCIVLKK